MAKNTSAAVHRRVEEVKEDVFSGKLFGIEKVPGTKLPILWRFFIVMDGKRVFESKANLQILTFAFMKKSIVKHARSFK